MSVALNISEQFNPIEDIIRDFLGEKVDVAKHVEESPEDNLCSICYCELTDPVNYCHELHKGTCKECIKQFISIQLSEAYAGSCPILWCPACKAVKVNRVLKFSSWKTEKQLESSYKKYMTLASSVIYMKCKGCHTNKDMLVTYQACPDITFNSEYLSDLHKYEINKYSIEEYYKKLIDEYLPNFDLKICEKSQIAPYVKKYGNELTVNFHFVLSTIENPERRMNLQLRFYRDYPRITTLCCQREHCFKCKTQFHVGKTCVEIENSTNKEQVDNEVVECPQCNLSLVKGDGCSTIHCVCGKEFNWQTEKERVTYIKKFLEQYNSEIKKGTITCSVHDYCADSVWNKNDKIALNWLRRYIESHDSLLSFLSKLYGPYVVHIFANLAQNTHSVTYREKQECIQIMINLLKQKHTNAYKTLSAKDSKKCIFTSQISSLSPKNAYKKCIAILKEKNIFDQTTLYAILWLSARANICEELFNIKTYDAFNKFWYTDLQTKLYSEQIEQQKMCIGSELVTSYQFSSSANILCKVNARKSLTVSAKNIISGFFIGINPAGNCYTGLHFNKSEIVLYHEHNGIEAYTQTSYLYKPNSIFNMTLSGNNTRQRLQIDINYGEIVFTFDVSDRNRFSDIQWLIKAKTELITIINNPISYWDSFRFETFQIVINQLQLLIKQINEDEQDESSVYFAKIRESAEKSKYSTLSDQYVMTITTANSIITLIDDYFNSLSTASEEIKNMNWNDVMYTIQWYAQHQKIINTESDEDMATRFLMNNIDDPAFAAILIVHKIKTGSNDDLKCAKAYMKCNSEFVNFAYQIDAENSEPIINGLKSGCNCIPRCSTRAECPTCLPTEYPIKTYRKKSSDEEEPENDEEEPEPESDDEEEPENDNDNNNDNDQNLAELVENFQPVSTMEEPVDAIENNPIIEEPVDESSENIEDNLEPPEPHEVSRLLKVSRMDMIADFTLRSMCSSQPISMLEGSFIEIDDLPDLISSQEAIVEEVD